MFGRQDDNGQADQPAQPQDIQAQEPVANEPAGETVHPDNPQPQPTDDSPWQHPGTPLNDAPADPVDPAPSPAPISDVGPANGPVAANDLHPAPDPIPADPIDDSAGDNSLVDIRQKALGDLSPLIGHLEHQTPEEKFQVTMMMIQANDDQSLIPTAYEAAQQISDEKTRAQALLDIVQEINYFTQHQQN
jgi:hypothetical protein